MNSPTFVMPALFALVLMIFLGCAHVPAPPPAPMVEAPWTAEMYVGVGGISMAVNGYDGLCYQQSRPIRIAIAPNVADSGDAVYVEYVVRHEMLHAIGWLGHPYATPSDDVVIYMDRFVPKDLTELPKPSATEVAYVEGSRATLWINLCAEDPALNEATRFAAAFWNKLAGRDIFRFRAIPATIR